jgi:hypothetical protein
MDNSAAVIAKMNEQVVEMVSEWVDSIKSGPTVSNLQKKRKEKSTTAMQE